MPGGGLHQQDGQGREGTSRQLRRRAKGNFFIRIGQVFSHNGRQSAQTGLRQPPADFSRSKVSAGEEKSRFSMGYSLNCGAVPAMGRHKLPILPGTSQPGGEQLYAGNTGQNLEWDAVFCQERQQAPCAGVEPGVAAENYRAVLLLAQDSLQQLGRADSYYLVPGTALGKMPQQPLCSQYAPRLPQRVQTFRRYSLRRPAAQRDQNYPHVIISLHCVKTAL